jgi:hypothetical protein
MTEYTRRQLRAVTRLALEDWIRNGDAETVNRAQAALDQMRHESKPDLREPYVYRVNIQPGLWLVVDASHNILLEVRTADEAELLAAYALPGVMGMINQLELCRTARDVAEQDDAELARARYLLDRAVGGLG